MVLRGLDIFFFLSFLSHSNDHGGPDIVFFLSFSFSFWQRMWSLHILTFFLERNSCWLTTHMYCSYLTCFDSKSENRFLSSAILPIKYSSFALIEVTFTMQHPQILLKWGKWEGWKRRFWLWGIRFFNLSFESVSNAPLPKRNSVLVKNAALHLTIRLPLTLPYASLR